MWELHLSPMSILIFISALTHQLLSCLSHSLAAFILVLDLVLGVLWLTSNLREE